MKQIRVVTATALFDGHDVSVNIFRRLLLARGTEVIHLGHSRSVQDVVRTAICEDADAVLVSSYQGGHNEYYAYLVDELKNSGRSDIMVFGGGGGVIQPAEIMALEEKGVEKIYHADEGKRLGIEGIADDILQRIRDRRENSPDESLVLDAAALSIQSPVILSRLITLAENRNLSADSEKYWQTLAPALEKFPENNAWLLGVTGTGGSGKSSLVDELITRFLQCFPELTIAILAVDPSKTLSGGALLGDRIRMNCMDSDRVFIRSLATRGSETELSGALSSAIELLRRAGTGLIIVETSGIGQADSRITRLCENTLYVMTSEFGAPTQLDKIDMLDLADFIAINKCDKPGAEDALREVLLHRVKALKISIPHTGRQALLDVDLPVFGTNAGRFNDAGVNALFQAIVTRMGEQLTGSDQAIQRFSTEGHRHFGQTAVESNALGEIARCVREYHQKQEKIAKATDHWQALQRSIELVEDPAARSELERQAECWRQQIPEDIREFLKNWPQTRAALAEKEFTYTVRGRNLTVETGSESLSGTWIPKVAIPTTENWGDLVRYRSLENLPGSFPYTAGVFPFKRTFEDPKRQFAGEGGPARTNRRFHYLCEGDSTRRLSVAFDGLTLYGHNPGKTPDVYGKIGESGVSICTLEDMKTLFAGFDLADPATSVSMTINGPAPVLLAMYFAAAVDQQAEKLGRSLNDDETMDLIRNLRGTVQADILKEDQGQNTCIFSIDFALRMMGDVQKFFAEQRIKNYYTISISGYHIAEAGANPLTQLAFTLANGFHYVEYFRSLGLDVNVFAPTLSFFFSNGMDPEYSVIGRVARRIWAVALRDRYGASESASKLKYHIQTSGRSLHAQDIQFNDIRTTLQAVLALADNCNSLHTNSYDEAVTTPTEESVRRAMAIQLICTKEFGILKNENFWQGSYLAEQLTDLVEEAVLEEFERISRRGGVLGAMERHYQRAKIQEESLYYESRKHGGQLPLVGVNTFLAPPGMEDAYDSIPISRAEPAEKDEQLTRLEKFHQAHQSDAPAALAALEQVILTGGNVFAELLKTVRTCSLGQISDLFYRTGGRYRRNM